MLNLSVWVISCKQTVQKRHNEISRISFASGGCYARCPLLAIEIDSDLSYKFYGGDYCEKQGYFIGRVSQSFWDSLNIKFESINYKTLDTSDISSLHGLSIQTIIFYNGHKRGIITQSASMPLQVDSLYRWLMYSYRKVDLVEQKDTIEFQTYFQYPPKLEEPKIRSK